MTTFGYCGVQSCGPVATATPALQSISRPDQGSAYANADGDALIAGIVAKRRRINLQQLFMLLPPATNPEDTLMNASAATSTGADNMTSSIWPPNTDGPSSNNDENPCYLSILANVQPSLGACWLVRPTTGCEQDGLATSAGVRCITANDAPCGATTHVNASTDSNRTTARSPSQTRTIVADVVETTSWTNPPAISRKRAAEAQMADTHPASALRGQLLSRQLAAAAAAAAAAGLPPRKGRPSNNKLVKTDNKTTATEQRVAVIKADTDPFSFGEADSGSHVSVKRSPPKQQHQQQQQQEQHRLQQLPGHGWVWNVVPTELSATDRTRASWPGPTEQKPASSSAKPCRDTSKVPLNEPAASALSILAAAAAAADSISEVSAAATAPHAKQFAVSTNRSWGRLCSSLPPSIATPSVTTGAPSRGSISCRSHNMTTLIGASMTSGDEPMHSMTTHMWSPTTQVRATLAPPPKCAVVTTGAATAHVTALRSGAGQPPPSLPIINASCPAAGPPATPTATVIRSPAQSATYELRQPSIRTLAVSGVSQKKDDMTSDSNRVTTAWRASAQSSAQEVPSTPAAEVGLRIFQTGYGQQQQQPSQRSTEGQREVVLMARHPQGPERYRSQLQSAQQSQPAVPELKSDTFLERTILTATMTGLVSPPPQQQQQQQQLWCDDKLLWRRQQGAQGAQFHDSCVANVPSNGCEQEAISRAMAVSEGQLWQQMDLQGGVSTPEIATASPAAPEALQGELVPCAERITLPASTFQQQLQAPARAATGATDAACATDVTATVDANVVATSTTAANKMTARETARSDIPAAMSGQPRTVAPVSSMRGWLASDAATQPALPTLERLLAAAAAAAQAAAAAAASVVDAVVPSAPHQLPPESLRVEPNVFLEPSGTLLQGDVLHTACRLIRLGRIRPSIAISLPWSESAATSNASPQGAIRLMGSNNSSGSGPTNGAGRGPAASSESKPSHHGAMESTAANAAAANTSQPTAPLFAVLRLLSDFAGAARALQMAEARQRAEADARAAAANDVMAGAETYRALWPLMRRGRKYAEMLMAKIEWTLTDNEDTPGDGDISSPERSCTTSI